MKRRSLIKNLVVFTGGVFLFSGCMGDRKPSSVFLKNISINADQELLLEELLETIIPESSTPGSKKLGLHLFVLKMVDECYEQAQRKVFTDGLIDFEESIREKFGKQFPECDSSQKKEILLQLEAKAFAESVTGFYTIARQQLIYGYTHSEYFMTTVRAYELVPGRYNGYFRVTPNKA